MEDETPIEERAPVAPAAAVPDRSKSWLVWGVLIAVVGVLLLCALLVFIAYRDA